MPNLPTDGVSQEIGRKASRALLPNMPLNWIEKDQSGDTDFGIDYIIQLKSDSDQLHYSFYLQLKGTTVPSYVEEGQYISHQLSVSTLNFYHRQEPCVMVAVVDLSDPSLKLAESPIYYLWLEDDWFKVHADKLATNESVSVRIPITNRITPELDIFPFYAERYRKRLSLNKLHDQIESISSDPLKSIKSLGDALVLRPVLLKIVEEKNEAPWVQNPEGSVANELKKCSESLSSNKLFVARRILERLKVESLNHNELAEFHYQEASLMTLEGEYDGAAENYKLAYETHSGDRYLAAYIDSQFKLKDLPAEEKLLEIVESLSSDTYQKCVIKAKCLALLNREKEALHLLDEHYPEKISGKMIVLTISGNTEELDAIIGLNKQKEFEHERDTFLFNAMAARRSFFKATAGHITTNETLPIHGKVDYTVNDMREAYAHASKAWEAALELGYPGDISILLEVSVLIYGYFNRSSELIQHLQPMLKGRSKNSELVRQYCRLLFNNHDYENVVKSIGELNAPSSEDCWLLILANYHLNNTAIVLQLVEQHEPILLEELNPNVAIVFCIAAEIAKAKLDNSLSEKYEKIVARFENGKEFLAISNFVRLSNQNPEKISQYLDELYEKYIEYGSPISIAEQMMGHFNSRIVESSQKIIELGSGILNSRALTPKESLHLAQAFFTTKRWSEAEKIADENIAKGIEISKWEIIKAASLEGQGKPGNAFQVVQLALQGDSGTKDAQEFYLHLSFVLGLTENVLEVVHDIIAKTTKREERIQYLRILIRAYSSDQKYSVELSRAVESLGSLVNQEDLEEEGLYLAQSLFSSFGEENEEIISEFQQRLAKYIQKFPDSPILKQAYIDPEAPAEAMVKTLQSLAGITEQQVKKWTRNKREIKSGRLPVPFCMLHGFLSDTRDIFTSWIYSLRMPEDSLEYKIRHAPQLEEHVFDRELSKRKAVLVEETSLLILNELNLLDLFLESVESIFLLNSSFQNINHSAHPISGSPANFVAAKILASLQKQLGKLRIINNGDENPIHSYTNAIADESYLFITDDLSLYMFINSTGKFSTANIYNVLEYLSKKSAISPEKMHELVMKTCLLGLYEPNMRIDFLGVSFSYYLNIIPGLDYSDTGFKAIFNKLFDQSRDSLFVCDLMFRLLNHVSLTMNVQLATLLSLLRGLAIRHPIQDFQTLISIWFINRALQVAPELTDGSILYCIRHNALWQQYKEAIYSVSESGSGAAFLLQPIIESLFSIPKKNREAAYKNIKLGFIPLTEEAIEFEKLYARFLFHSQLSQN